MQPEKKKALASVILSVATLLLIGIVIVYYGGVEEFRQHLATEILKNSFVSGVH